MDQNGSAEMTRKQQLQEMKNLMFRLQGSRLERCLEPREECEAKAIKAHSIAKSSVLNQLCEDNHVVMPVARQQSDAPPTVEFRRVGKNTASTFTGLCARHDNQIFRPIDDFSFDVLNPEHLFLLAYRSVLNELHAVMQGAARIQVAYQKRV